jgi:hypothetical protein
MNRSGSFSFAERDPQPQTRIVVVVKVGEPAAVGKLMSATRRPAFSGSSMIVAA